MKSTYNQISAMEPLLPDPGRMNLEDLIAEILLKAGELNASIPSSDVRRDVAALLVEMNSYYSNSIEGHKTLPRDIQRALREDFSKDEKTRKNQKLSVAHIETERKMRELLSEDPATDVFSPEFICWLHNEFYCRLPREYRVSEYKSGEIHEVIPGKPRDYNVDVGLHTPPDHKSVKIFLNRFSEVYSNSKIYPANKLVAIAAAHHRLAWIHPFGDGNGRVARLQSHAALIKAKIDGEGLWTLSRGLARQQQKYYEMLAHADMQRQGATDGRGNLSESALGEFCRFFLNCILDQLNFMTGLVRPLEVADRINSYFIYERQDLRPKEREQLSKLLKALWIEGPIVRGKVQEILGLGETAAGKKIRKALTEGLIGSESKKGKIRIVFPSDILESYFPRLYTDLQVEEE